ncbi:hypothetical protein DASC09_016220 [Saccharomycopsis crataegensis]|uniref:Uncharacterized protein n=1 Tax=Saccharomycopsis crataegensis TaxID=43959 RepID=A0AAV5QI62_9ASCO|nr:hypothetical protein DASC09_016220 [Saccharomycopsis crataegensis]
MLASLFNKGVSSPIESPSLYSASPLSLVNTESDNISKEKVNNFPLYGSNDISHFNFDKNDFRILVLEDTGHLYSTDRYYVLYDSDLEKAKLKAKKAQHDRELSGRTRPDNNSRKLNDSQRNKKPVEAIEDLARQHFYDKSDIRVIAGYLFGSSFKAKSKQTSRIHCEPQDKKLNKKLRNKTLAVRAYHFDANFEDSLINRQKTGASDVINASSQSLKASSSLNFNTDIFDRNKSAQSLHTEPQAITQNDITEEMWTADPATKIDHDFGSKNNTPIGICIVLPFSAKEFTQTVGANFQDFENWLYELQDLTLKYLKRYYSRQVSSSGAKTKHLLKPDSWYGNNDKPKSTNNRSHEYFMVDDIQGNKIYFNEYILQDQFESESVFLNYYHRINFFMNTPRVITGMPTFEKLLKFNFIPQATSTTSPKSLVKKPSKRLLFLLFCKEVRNWLTIHDSVGDKSCKFLSTLLSLIYPIREQLVNSRPSNKKRKIIRLVFYSESDPVINSLMNILSCFLPDVIFHYDVLTETEFNNSKSNFQNKLCEKKSNSEPSQKLKSWPASNTTHSKTLSISDPKQQKIPEDESAVDTSYESIDGGTQRPTVKNTLPSLDLSAIDKFDAETKQNSRPTTPYPYNLPPSPVISKISKGLRLSSPKSIPTAQASTYDTISVYSSQSENSSYKSDFDQFSYFPRSNSITSNNNMIIQPSSRITSRSSSFIQHEDDLISRMREPRRRLVKTISVADLTQKSIRASNSSLNKGRLFSKKMDLLQRTPTALLNINAKKYSTLSEQSGTSAGKNENENKPDFSSLNISKIRNTKNVNDSNKIVALENERFMKDYIYDMMLGPQIETDIDLELGVLAVDAEGERSQIINEYSEEYLYEDNNDFEISLPGDQKDGALEYEMNSEKYLNDDEFGKIILPSSEIYLPPLVGASREFIPEFTVQTLKKNDNIKASIIDAMKKDLFHNNFIDKCYDNPSYCHEGDPTGKRSITKTYYVNLMTREIQEFEIILKIPVAKQAKIVPNNDSTTPKGISVGLTQTESNLLNEGLGVYGGFNENSFSPVANLSRSINTHLRHSSVFSMSSTSSSSASSSPHQSPSPIRSSASILSLFDFGNSYLTNNNPFNFQDKDFVLIGNRIMDEQGRLCSKELQGSINEMDLILNIIANYQDDVDL